MQENILSCNDLKKKKKEKKRRNIPVVLNQCTQGLQWFVWDKGGKGLITCMAYSLCAHLSEWFIKKLDSRRQCVKLPNIELAKVCLLVNSALSLPCFNYNHTWICLMNNSNSSLTLFFWMYHVIQPTGSPDLSVKSHLSGLMGMGMQCFGFIRGLAWHIFSMKSIKMFQKNTGSWYILSLFNIPTVCKVALNPCEGCSLQL